MINDDLVFLDVDASSKESVIDLFTKRLIDAGCVNGNGNVFKSHIWNRENDISTDMGNNVAIPHAKSKDIIKPFISYLRLKKPVTWNDQKKSKVSMIFVLGVPDKAENGVHLKMLSDLARKLIDNEFLHTLSNVSNSEEAVELLKS